MNKSVSKNKITILNIASTGILQGLSFFSGPIFSSVLGPNNYGITTVYLTWVQLASTIFSLQAGGTVAIARIHFPSEDQKKYQSSVLSLAFFSYLCFSILTVFLLLLIPSWIEIDLKMLIIGLLHGWGLYCVSFMNSKLTYEFKADKNFVLTISITIFTIGMSLLLINFFPDDSNYWGRILGQAIVYTVFGFILFVYLLVKGRTLFKKEYWMFTIPICIPTIFHLLANITLNQSDKVMLQEMENNSVVGIYALACTFSTVLNSLWTAFNNSWVPFYYEYTKENRIDQIKAHARNYIELFTVITIGFIFLSKEVFHLYANRSFWEGTDLLPLFSIGAYFVFLYSFPVNYEFFNKKTKTIALGTTLAAISNIILNYFLINCVGIMGAVIATTVSHGLQFFFHYVCARKINPGEFPFCINDFVPGFFAVCTATFFYMITKDLWFIRWICGVLLGIFILIKIFKRKEIF